MVHLFPSTNLVSWLQQNCFEQVWLNPVLRSCCLFLQPSSHPPDNNFIFFVCHPVDCNNEVPCYRQTQLVYYFNACKVHLLLFCTMTNKCTIISQVITFLHVSTLSCHPQRACNQYLAKSHKYLKCSWW